MTAGLIPRRQAAGFRHDKRNPGLAKPSSLWPSTIIMTNLLSRKIVTWLCALLACVSIGVSAAVAQSAAPLAAPVISWVELGELPREARDTLSLIKAGGPFPYDKDGTRFGNRERVLPAKGPDHYTEYTVRTPGEKTRGARRIVAGGEPRTSGEYYYTDDHYKTFRRIRETGSKPGS